MNYKKNFFKKNKALVILFSVIILFFLVFFIYLNHYDINFSYLRDGYYKIISFFSKRVDVDYDYVSKGNIDTLQKRVNELEDMLDFKETNSTFKIVNCNIVSYSMINLFDTLIINKGSSDGLKVNMLAINNDGVVGVISKVYKSTSEVKLLTANVNIPVKINGVNAILNSYKDGYLIASLINSKENIEKGSIVITSEVGGMYMANMKVGVVEDFYMDDVGVEKNIKIKTDVDFYNLNYLSILVGNRND